MTIEDTFSHFLNEKELIHTLPLSRLRNSKIAVDAHDWMKAIQTELNEPLHMVTGGVPLTLESVVRRDLNGFEKSGVKPVFVFNGLPLFASQSPKYTAHNPYLLELYEKRERAWRNHHEGSEESVKEFVLATTHTITPDFQHQLLLILRKAKAEYFKAPFMSWAQMSYWCAPQVRYVHQIQAPTELLMFQHVEVLILSFNFQAMTYNYVVKSEIMSTLDSVTEGPPITASQFLDCCLLTGLKGQIKHPKHFNNNSTFQKLVTTVKAKSAKDLLLSTKPRQRAGPKSANLPRNHMMLRAIIWHGLVLTNSGHCVPLTDPTYGLTNMDPSEEVPNNLSDLWGHRLPNIMYYFLAIGVIQTQMLGHVVQNQMVETIPFMDTEEYRSLLHKLLPLRRQIVHQLIVQLGEDGTSVPCSYQREVMKCWRWDISGAREVSNPSPIRLDEWDLSGIKLPQPTVRPDGSTEKVDFAYVIEHFGLKAAKSIEYRTYDEVLCAVHLKSLDLLGYFTHVSPASAGPIGYDEPPSGLSVFADILLEAKAPEFGAQLVLFVELLRTKTLASAPFQYAKPSDTQSRRNSDVREKPDNRVHYPEMKLPRELEGALEAEYLHSYDHDCRLVSRIWSLLPMQFNNEAWAGDVSKDLLAFNTVVKTLHKTLRALVEVTTSVLFLSGVAKVDLSSDELHELPAVLPFAQESSTAMGIVINYIMRSSADFGLGLTTREERLAHLQSKFSSCKDIGADLHYGVRFWLAVRLVIIEAVDREVDPSVIVPAALKSQFVHADEFLREQLANVIDLDGYSFAMLQ